MQFVTEGLPEDAHVWAACRQDGAIYISKVFATFDEACDAYVAGMQRLVADYGADLSTYHWDGVHPVSDFARVLAAHYQFTAAV